MLDLAALGSCSEITSAHAKQAASSPAEMRALLDRVAAIARPGEGCPKVLRAVAYLIGQQWVDGRLYVELAGDDDATVLTVMADYGASIRERILPATRFEVPFDEFARALELAPSLVLPLRITDAGTKLVLTPLLTPEEEVLAQAPPPAFEVEDKSLGEDLRDTAPPPPIVATLLRESMREPPTRPDGAIVTDPDD